jgi:hypothetical protein
MSFKTRYILIAIFNFALMLGFFLLSIVRGWDIDSKKLTQIQLSNPQDVELLVAFAALLLLDFGINLVLLYTRRHTPIVRKEDGEVLISLPPGKRPRVVVSVKRRTSEQRRKHKELVSA